MTKKLKIEFPSQGWTQILTSRKEVLDSYDRAREKARAHEVETFHGKVAEAEIRKWLSGFLPKRYGVTSGYIISPGLKSNERAPHFDVIIYDQLESPVLWIEDNPDASEQGRSIAIPVEYVRSVLEVKSTFSATTVRASLQHLEDLAPLLNGLDDAAEVYKLHLPPTFSCGLVFFETRTEHDFSEAALAAVTDGIKVRGFFGGIILRAESLTVPHTGRITLRKSKTPTEGMLAKGQTPIWEYGESPSKQISDEDHIYSAVRWSESAFAKFAFDLIAMVQGTYDPRRLSSLYGRGNSFAELIQDIGGTIIELN